MDTKSGGALERVDTRGPLTLTVRELAMRDTLNAKGTGASAWLLLDGSGYNQVENNQFFAQQGKSVWY